MRRWLRRHESRGGRSCSRSVENLRNFPQSKPEKSAVLGRPDDLKLTPTDGWFNQDLDIFYPPKAARAALACTKATPAIDYELRFG